MKKLKIDTSHLLYKVLRCGDMLTIEVVSTERSVSYGEVRCSIFGTRWDLARFYHQSLLGSLYNLLTIHAIWSGVNMESNIAESIIAHLESLGIRRGIYDPRDHCVHPVKDILGSEYRVYITPDRNARALATTEDQGRALVAAEYARDAAVAECYREPMRKWIEDGMPVECTEDVAPEITPTEEMLRIKE